MKRFHATFLSHVHFLCPLAKPTGWDNVVGVAIGYGLDRQGF